VRHQSRHALDVLPSGRRRLPVDLDRLDVIRDAGFDTVRLPTAWSEHALSRAPFDISPQFFAAVDGLVLGALERDLSVVVNVHHHEDVCAQPAAHRRRYLALWTQIADRYADLPSTVTFELLNEPHRRLTGGRWNELLAAALAVVRDRSRVRDVIIGPAEMNTIAGLTDLQLPDDPHLIVTIHYYSPLPFTHQGAGWMPHADEWLGTRWGTATERANVRADLAAAAAWTNDRRERMFIGEFGTFHRAPPDDRVAWTAHVRSTAEELGIPWCYWDFATDFGVYDANGRRWNERLLAALLPT
jgi:endoglucanase